MQPESLIIQAKKLDSYVLNLPLAKSLNTMSRDKREAMIELRNSVFMAKGHITKFIVSDDSKEKQQSLEASIKHLKGLNEQIINASEYELIDAVDVAHLSAIVETIKERLE